MVAGGGVFAKGGVGVARKRWADASTWEGDGLRREVFFFESRGTLLYGSLFAATEVSRPFGVLCCNSWGVEADRSDPLQRAVALAMARLGGAGLVFHCPGHGDSYGDLAAVELEDLSQAACDAVAEAKRRLPGVEWMLAGFMLGASVAALARPRVGARRLLLVQPALRPGSYFRWLRRAAKTMPLRFSVAQGLAHGYPIPCGILAAATEADELAEHAFAKGGAATAIRYAESAGPPPGPLPERCELIEVPGRWRFGSREDPDLASEAAGWLDRVTRDDER